MDWEETGTQKWSEIVKNRPFRPENITDHEILTNLAHLMEQNQPKKSKCDGS